MKHLLLPFVFVYIIIVECVYQVFRCLEGFFGCIADMIGNLRNWSH